MSPYFKVLFVARPPLPEPAIFDESISRSYRSLYYVTRIFSRTILRSDTNVCGLLSVICGIFSVFSFVTGISIPFSIKYPSVFGPGLATGIMAPKLDI